ncbi:hypothetical protein KFU94_61795 [Chloroflexi bacterium TSY]|nr:hypothetical protein [Chloroflexi bacterium TSY]
MDKTDKRTDSLVAEFTKHFGTAPTHVAIGPGRVMLRQRADRTVQLYSLEYDSHGSFNLDTVDERSDQPWMNYVKGVAGRRGTIVWDGCVD